MDTHLKIDCEIISRKHPDLVVAELLTVIDTWIHDVQVTSISKRPRQLFTCDQCSTAKFRMVILHDELWLSIANKLDYLCHECIEERLGRKIRISDLKPCGITDDILWARQLE